LTQLAKTGWLDTRYLIPSSADKPRYLVGTAKQLIFWFCLSDFGATKTQRHKGNHRLTLIYTDTRLHGYKFFIATKTSIFAKATSDKCAALKAKRIGDFFSFFVDFLYGLH
jgi:hypothetical protein